MQSLRVLTVVQAAATYDLTDIATVKDELSIAASETTKDAWLSRAISQQSSVIANYCRRVFHAEHLLEATLPVNRGLYGGALSNSDVLQLQRWPIVAITSLVENGSEIVAGTDYSADLASGQALRLSSGCARPWALAPLTVSYIAGYTAEAAETSTVAASVAVAKASAFVFDRGVTFINGDDLSKVDGAPGLGEYAVSSAGIYTFNVGNVGSSVRISYAYSKIPDDLVEACLRLITMRFKARGRDPMLMGRDQPNLGSERFWVGPAPGQNGAIPPEIASLIDHYRVPRFG